MVARLGSGQLRLRLARPRPALLTLGLGALEDGAWHGAAGTEATLQLPSMCMELGVAGRSTGDQVQQQLQSVEQMTAYLGGGFLLSSGDGGAEG
jgi:hypothetical protein